jgi:catechol 2,3-dioxygenase-like lactoylglutathione lyase family enzyme
MDLRVHQVVLTVSSLERSVQFYSQFGFIAENHICKGDGRERITMRSMLSEFELKLFANPSPKPLRMSHDLQDYLTEIGTRYMSLLCDDVDDFYERYKTQLDFIRKPKTGMTGCRYAFFTDPDGILVEVYQKNYTVSS